MSVGRKRKPRTVRYAQAIESLFEAAEEQGLADYVVSASAGLSDSYVNQLRRGLIDKPSFSAIASLAEVLGFDLVLQKRGTE